VLISPTFYWQLLCAKVYCEAFIYLQFGFVIFRQKSDTKKAACKMLVKLTKVVDNRHFQSGEKNNFYIFLILKEILDF